MLVMTLSMEASVWFPCPRPTYIQAGRKEKWRKNEWNKETRKATGREEFFLIWGGAIFQFQFQLRQSKKISDSDFSQNKWDRSSSILTTLPGSMTSELHVFGQVFQTRVSEGKKLFGFWVSVEDLLENPHSSSCHVPSQSLPRLLDQGNLWAKTRISVSKNKQIRRGHQNQIQSRCCHRYSDGSFPETLFCGLEQTKGWPFSPTPQKQQDIVHVLRPLWGGWSRLLGGSDWLDVAGLGPRSADPDSWRAGKRRLGPTPGASGSPWWSDRVTPAPDLASNPWILTPVLRLPPDQC